MKEGAGAMSDQSERSLARHWALLSPEEKKELILPLVVAGLTSGKIAERVGASRGAVLGFAARAGLKIGGGQTTPRSIGPRRNLKRRPARDAAARPMAATIDAPHAAIFLDRKTSQCPWIIDGDDVPAFERRCCGAPKALTDGFCAAHMRIVYVPCAERADAARCEGDSRRPLSAEAHRQFAGAE